MKQRRYLSLFLALVLSLVFLPSLAVIAEDEEHIPAEGYPLETPDGEPVKFVYWTALNGNVSANFTNLGDTPLYQELMDRTGVEIEFLHPAAGQDQEALTLMLTGGELPDIIEYPWQEFAGGPAKALDDYNIIPLNDLLEENAPALTHYLDIRPDVKQQAMTDDGTIFAFPFIRGHKDLQVSAGLVVRKDWLDDLGLEVPETIDEWETVLTAFKDEKEPLPH